jgi:hypothetical protein
MGLDYENPYHHLREFEQLCECLTISGMSQEIVRWKLFPFSLDERAKQCYTHNIGKVAGDWEELRNKFSLAFSLYPKFLPYDKRYSTSNKKRRNP